MSQADLVSKSSVMCGNIISNSAKNFWVSYILLDHVCKTTDDYNVAFYVTLGRVNPINAWAVSVLNTPAAHYRNSENRAMGRNNNIFYFQIEWDTFSSSPTS